MRRKYWHRSGAALCAILMTAGTLWAIDSTDMTTVDKDPKVRFEAAQPEEHYLEGAVPVENGKVTFRREITLPGLSQSDIFDRIKTWATQPDKDKKDLILDRLITYEDREKGILKIESREYLVFTATTLALDRAQFAVSQTYTCMPGKRIIELTNLRYFYENQNRVPEGWITDDYALNKDKTSIYKGVRRMRIKTVDWADALFEDVSSCFVISQIGAPMMAQQPMTTPATTPATPLTPAPTPQATPATPATPAVQPAPAVPAAPSAPTTSPTPAAPFAVAETPLALPASTPSGETMAGYKRIDPEKIPGNIIKMLNEDWMLITAGNSTKFNMMTASWGGLGVLFGKPSAFCFINPMRYTYSLMEQGDTYTLTFYTEAYRDALKLCGTVSGKDTDKVQASGLTPITTPSGAQAFAEAWMVIECRKMVVQPLSQGVITDPSIRQQFEGKPVNTLFVGEILNVWIK